MVSGLSVDLVICTRNRATALTYGLKAVSQQSRMPDNVIIVDSSDTPEPIRQVVNAFSSYCSVPIRLEVGPRGSSVQRNVGASISRADVIVFPDDDSLLYPNAIEEIMRVYEADRTGEISAVCGREANVPPPGVLDGRLPYRMNPSDTAKNRFGAMRYALERHFAPTDPFLLISRKLMRMRKMPAIVDGKSVVAVPFMSGFRMSFRRSVILHNPFDENFRNYGLFEDVDASLAAQRTGLVVGANSASIFHYKDPSARGTPEFLAAAQFLNRAYIVRKHSSATEWLPALKRHLQYKLAQYALGARSSFGRRRLRAAIRAYRELPVLFEESAAKLADRYHDSFLRASLDGSHSKG